MDEYRKNIEKDAALERRFQTIIVEAPSVDETIQILKGLRDKYEAHHRVKFTDEAVEAAAKFSDRYITGRYQPDKAIDLIDEAGARARLSVMTAPPDVSSKSSVTIHKPAIDAFTCRLAPLPGGCTFAASAEAAAACVYICTLAPEESGNENPRGSVRLLALCTDCTELM